MKFTRVGYAVYYHDICLNWNSSGDLAEPVTGSEPNACFETLKEANAAIRKFVAQHNVKACTVQILPITKRAGNAGKEVAK